MRITDVYVMCTCKSSLRQRLYQNKSLLSQGLCDKDQLNVILQQIHVSVRKHDGDEQIVIKVRNKNAVKYGMLQLT